MVKIGIVMKYTQFEDGRDIVYLSEMIRRTFQRVGCFVIPIVPVQDVNYNSTKYNEFKELTDSEKKIIDKYLDMVDGVVFPGGFKISLFDKYILDKCVQLDIPTLGICLGMQTISNYKRNFLVEENNSSINHKQDDDDLLVHKVIINKDTLLYKILGKEEIMVNSFHKYHAVENDCLVVNARSCDGYIEGVEFKNKKFIMGLQWHPEISYSFDLDSQKIINYFVNVCKSS